MRMLIVLLLTVFSPQDISYNKEYNLISLSSSHNGVFTLVQEGGTACGKYFYQQSVNNQPKVYFEFSTMGQLVVPSFFHNARIDKQNITTLIERKVVPTVEIVNKDNLSDPLSAQWIIRISDNDFRESRLCIPEPK